MAAAPYPAPIPITSIAENGNVVLVVGLNQKKFCILSSALAAKSQVFRAMFGPNFLEGQDLSKEIKMPDDDEDAMEILCILIHHPKVNPSAPEDPIPEKLEPSRLVEFMLVADKYDCSLNSLPETCTERTLPGPHPKHHAERGVYMCPIHHCAITRSDVLCVEDLVTGFALTAFWQRLQTIHQITGIDGAEVK